MRHLAWIFEHWDDIVSDFSVLHRIDDPDVLTIGRFLALTIRLSAYTGALRARFTAPPLDAAGTASPGGEPLTVPVTGGDGEGDTPPEVIRQIKAAQFARRHGADPSVIKWDDAAVLRELMHG